MANISGSISKIHPSGPEKWGGWANCGRILTI